jgi:hypothetical protein
MADVPPERPLHLLTSDARQQAVLFERAPDGTIRLPLLGLIDDIDPHPPIAALVERYLGHEQAILRVISVDGGPQDGATSILVATEPVADRESRGAVWVRLGDPRLEGLRGDAAVGPYVARWLDELETGASDPRRQRWEHPGFQDRARRWMRAQLEAAGTPAIAEPTVEKLWPISAMLRAHTTDGRAFMKACAWVFDVEPAATAALHRVVPGAVPEVIATDTVEGWLLMRDAGGVHVGDQPPDTWPESLATLAAIQQASGRGLDGIVLEDRGPAALGASLAALLESAFVAGFPEDIGPRFRTAAPRLLDACDRLASLGPGPTVVHGDFHPWNVLRAGERIVVIDWSDAATGHPFTDLANWLNRVSDPAARRSMLDAWLDCWADAAPRADLEEVARLALPVGALHQVESYRRITESLEPGSDCGLAGGGPGFARWALAWLEDGLGATVAR